MRKGKKVLKVIGIILASLVAFILVLHTFLNIIFGIQLRNKIAQLKREGRPMTIAEIVPLPVPDAENAALLYNKAFALMELPEIKDALEKIKDLKSYSDISEWTDKQRIEIPKLINSRDMQYVYELLEQGSKKSKCNFNPNYEDGPAMKLPHLSKMRDSMRLFCAKALLETESGNMEGAFSMLLIGLKISNHLRDEPNLLSQLVRIACDEIIMKCIESISNPRNLISKQATLIMDELTFHKDVELFVKCMEMERVGFGMWIFERILRGKVNDLVEIELDMGGSHAFATVAIFLAKPILKKDYIHYLTLMSKIQDSYDLPYYEVAEQIKWAWIEEQLPRYCILTRMAMPALDKFRQSQTIHQANIDICGTGLALKLYKAKNSNYPETLTKLVPEFLKEVPTDPFSGKGLIYSRYIGGFKLYSIGPNMQDDFGTPRAKKDNEPASKDYDIVWESEA